jgi:hypothetical protein
MKALKWILGIVGMAVLGFVLPCIFGGFGVILWLGCAAYAIYRILKCRAENAYWSLSPEERQAAIDKVVNAAVAEFEKEVHPSWAHTCRYPEHSQPNWNSPVIYPDLWFNYTTPDGWPASERLTRFGKDGRNWWEQ